LFDHQITVQRFGGASRYVVSLLRELNRLPGIRAELAALAHVNGYLRPDDALQALSFRLDWPLSGMRFRSALAEPLFRVACAMSQPDIVHETLYMPQAESRSRRRPTVTTLHDMILERIPQLFKHPEQQKADRYKALRRAQAIICISENTRIDLLSTYPEFDGKAHVVWHGVDPTVSTAPRPADRIRPYLLFVGVRRGYKNFDRLLQAMGQSPELASEFDLVCFGGGTFTAEERAAIARCGLRQAQVVHVAGDDASLAAAYRHATCFVFPSAYEGFGMPLTEAMVQGCPIVCSRASSFPEIAADAAAYFEAEDVDALRAAIESVALNEEWRHTLAARGQARASVFSWQRCARETAAVYRNVCDHRSA
jgi:glycosyltransferase involved in cell wall biosynthesis